MILRAISALAFALVYAAGASAQGIVVDQGEFSIRVAGRNVGTETFAVRRAGIGRDDAFFANGVVTLRVGERTQEIRPLLRAAPRTGSAESYQVTVTGPDEMDARFARSGRRYVATIRSAAGDEDREFQARAETRILESDVAHHYYFLRDVREGETVYVIEPRTRRQLTLVPSAPVEEEITLGPNSVDARRVTFTDESGEERHIWFDQQGRVLRVEIPSSAYFAERTDLVG